MFCLLQALQHCRTFCNAFLVGVLFLLGWSVSSCAANDELTSEELLDAYESGLGLVHSLQGTLLYEENVFDGAGFQSIARVSFWWDGQEALRLHDVVEPRWRPPTADGRPENILDVLEDGKTRRILRNWDLENPQEITPAKTGTASAEIYPLHRDEFVPRDPRVTFLRRFVYSGGREPYYTLRELVTASPEVIGPERTTLDDMAAWKLRVVYPGVRDTETGVPQSPDGSYFEFYFLSAYAFYIGKVIERHPNHKWSDSKGEHIEVVDYVRKVNRFEGFDNGVFLPMEIDYRVETPSVEQPSVIMRTRVTDIEVNQPLPDKVFSLPFPENIHVFDHTAPDGIRKWYIWGKGNTPKDEIKTREDRARYAIDSDRPDSTSESWSPGIIFLVAINILILVALAGYVMSRKWRKGGEV